MKPRDAILSKSKEAPTSSIPGPSPTTDFLNGKSNTTLHHSDIKLTETFRKYDTFGCLPAINVVLRPQSIQLQNI